MPGIAPIGYHWNLMFTWESRWCLIFMSRPKNGTSDNTAWVGIVILDFYVCFWNGTQLFSQRGPMGSTFIRRTAKFKMAPYHHLVIENGQKWQPCQQWSYHINQSILMGLSASRTSRLPLVVSLIYTQDKEVERVKQWMYFIIIPSLVWRHAWSTLCFHNNLNQ